MLAMYSREPKQDYINTTQDYALTALNIINMLVDIITQGLIAP